MAIIQADKKNGLKKFAVGCKSLSRNGKILLSFNTPTDVFVERKNNVFKITIADRARNSKPLVNKL